MECSNCGSRLHFVAKFILDLAIRYNSNSREEEAALTQEAFAEAESNSDISVLSAEEVQHSHLAERSDAHAILRV